MCLGSPRYMCVGQHRADCPRAARLGSRQHHHARARSLAGNTSDDEGVYGRYSYCPAAVSEHHHHRRPLIRSDPAASAIAAAAGNSVRFLLLLAPACSLSNVLERWAAQRRLPPAVVEQIRRCPCATRTGSRPASRRRSKRLCRALATAGSSPATRCEGLWLRERLLAIVEGRAASHSHAVSALRSAHKRRHRREKPEQCGA